MRRFRKEFGLKKARILRERLIPVSQGLKIGINRQPLLFYICFLAAVLSHDHLHMIFCNVLLWFYADSMYRITVDGHGRYAFFHMIRILNMNVVCGISVFSRNCEEHSILSFQQRIRCICQSSGQSGVRDRYRAGVQGCVQCKGRVSGLLPYRRTVHERCVDALY